MMQLDLALFNAIHRFWGTSRVLDALGTFLANILTYLMVAGMFVFLFYAAHSNRERIFLASEMLLAYIFSRWIITGNIAFIIKRARPFQSLGFTPPFVPLTEGSMPSGHTSALFAIATVMFAFNPLWGTIYLILAFLVALGRVFVGVHWPSDILAGILIGIGSGLVIHRLLAPERQEVFAGSSALADNLSEDGV